MIRPILILLALAMGACASPTEPTSRDAWDQTQAERRSRPVPATVQRQRDRTEQLIVDLETERRRLRRREHRRGREGVAHR